MDTDKVVDDETIKTKKFVKTNLTWDHYIDYLIEAIDESNFMKRSEVKPMATPKDDLETHLTSRATHVRNAADIAKRIAKGLNLNHKYAYAGMLMHDAGHPFSAHEGEEMFTQIGEIYNVQYFHHNAKGVEVIKSENICEKAISKIPNIRNNPELKRKLEEEFPYFLDIVVSHDGEASAKDMNKKEDYYPDIKTAVRSKVTQATAENRYKCIAQTTEGKIAKFADVIAYLATDIRDGFRLGIYKDFPEEYLELFGEMFAEDYASTPEEKVQVARNIINQIKEERLRELVQDAKSEENRDVINEANKITGEISENEINFETDSEKVDEIVKKHIETYRKTKGYANMTDEEKSFLDSETQRIEEFVGKKLRVRSSVVSEVTSRMQEFFINDLLKNSTDSGKLQFSPTATKLFFKAKKINYETYVPGTKWLYQKDAQPRAAYGLVDICARSLIKSGAIAHKFYDKSMRQHITDEEAISYLKTQYRSPEVYEEYKKQHNIRNIKTSKSRYTSSTATDRTTARKELFGNIYEYTQNEGETFAVRYMNTFKAIETQVRAKVQKAIDPAYELKIVEEPKKFAELCRSKTDTDISKMRKRLLATHHNLETITENEQEKFTKALIQEEREKMEEKMAIQISIDYLAGMTDRGFNELAVQTGFMKREDLTKSRVDIETALAENKKVQELAAAMQETGDSSKQEEGR